MAMFGVDTMGGDFESAKSASGALSFAGGGITFGAQPDKISMPLIIGAVALVLIVMLKRGGK